MSPPDRASRHRKHSFTIAAVAAGLFAAAPASAANGSVVYTYDALGRITTASYDTGVCIGYTYDANGNRLSEKILVTSPTSTGVWGCFNWNNARWGP
jgi:YD repeat-containing protein